MSLATRCPACGTIFRVVQDQLKVSEGWVRCGQCHEVFHGIEALFDLDSDPGIAARRAAARPPQPPTTRVFADARANAQVPLPKAPPPPAVFGPSPQPSAFAPTAPGGFPPTAPASLSPPLPLPPRPAPMRPPIAIPARAPAPVDSGRSVSATPSAFGPASLPQAGDLAVGRPGFAPAPAPNPVAPVIARGTIAPRFAARLAEESARAQAAAPAQAPRAFVEPPTPAPTVDLSDPPPAFVPPPQALAPAPEPVAAPMAAPEPQPEQAPVFAPAPAFAPEPTPLQASEPPAPPAAEPVAAPAAAMAPVAPEPEPAPPAPEPAARSAAELAAAFAAPPPAPLLPPVPSPAPEPAPAPFAVAVVGPVTPPEPAPAETADGSTMPSRLAEDDAEEAQRAGPPTLASMLPEDAGEWPPRKQRKKRGDGPSSELALVDPSKDPRFLREARSGARWRKPWVRAVLGVALVLGIAGAAGQVAWPQRDTLAARWPAARPAWDWLCAQAGCRIEAPRALASLALDGSSLTRTDTEHVLLFSADLHNRSDHEVRMPSFDLSFMDLNGAIVARKVLSPAQIGIQQASLPPEGELHVHARLQVGGLDATGFQADLFYP